MPTSLRHIGLALLLFAASTLTITETLGAWPTHGSWPQVRTATTSIPGHYGEQYSFEFTAEPVDSATWSSVFRKVPDGQIGRIEGISYAQATAFANAVSKHENREACYVRTGCTGEPTDADHRCESIEAKSVSCEGARLPTRREIDLLRRIDRHAQIAQWSSEGELVDARGVRSADEKLDEIVGFLLVQTVDYELNESD
jgi:hypothetical protein